MRTTRISSTARADAIAIWAPWTEGGFRASWRTFRIQLEKAGRIGPDLTLYGLRHTVAVILRESGADERTKTIEMARRYARGADLKRKMRGVMVDFEREVDERRTKIVKPDLKTVKPETMKPKTGWKK